MRKLFLAVAGLGMLGACGDAAGTGGAPSGVYSLSTVDGKSLPVTLSGCLVLKSARIEFRDGARYAAFAEYGQGDICVASASEIGAVTVVGNSIALKNDAKGTRTLMRDRQSLRETVSAKGYVYSR